MEIESSIAQVTRETIATAKKADALIARRANKSAQGVFGGGGTTESSGGSPRSIGILSCQVWKAAPGGGSS